MFIERRIQKILFAPEERDIGPGEKHVSLLWSEAVLFGKGSIDISPLRGEDPIVVLSY
jgi:hypothetical protein